MCLKIHGERLFQNMNTWVTTELMVNALKWKCCHIALNCRGINQQQKTDLFVLHTPQHWLFCKFSMYRIMYFINFHPFQRPSFDLIQIFVVSSISVKLPKFVWQWHHNQQYINVAFTALCLFHKWVQYVREQTYMQCNHKKHYQTRNVSQNWCLLSGLPKVFYKTNNLQSMGMLWLKILQSILYSLYDSIEYLCSF